MKQDKNEQNFESQEQDDIPNVEPKQFLLIIILLILFLTVPFIFATLMSNFLISNSPNYIRLNCVIFEKNQNSDKKRIKYKGKIDLFDVNC